MRRGMTNYLQFRIVGMNLTGCTNMKLMIEQNGVTYTFSGSKNSTYNDIMDVTIPKATAVKLQGMPAKFQVALTDSNGIPRSHEPIIAYVGDLLEVTGYGS